MKSKDKAPLKDYIDPKSGNIINLTQAFFPFSNSLTGIFNGENKELKLSKHNSAKMKNKAAIGLILKNWTFRQHRFS